MDNQVQTSCARKNWMRLSTACPIAEVADQPPDAAPGRHPGAPGESAGTNPTSHGDIKHGRDAVGTFPDEDNIVRRLAAIPRMGNPARPLPATGISQRSGHTPLRVVAL